MAETTGHDGGPAGPAGAQQLDALLASAQELQSAAKAANLEFVSYLAEMTVLEIKHEIARSADPSP